MGALIYFQFLFKSCLLLNLLYVKQIRSYLHDLHILKIKGWCTFEDTLGGTAELSKNTLHNSMMKRVCIVATFGATEGSNRNFYAVGGDDTNRWTLKSFAAYILLSFVFLNVNPQSALVYTSSFPNSY